MNKIFTNFIMMIFIVGCTKQCSRIRGEMSPDQVLEEYLSVVFNMDHVDQKELLLEYTAGNLKAAISGATPETIRAAYIENPYNLKSFSIVHRTDLTPKEIEITYHLAYEESSLDGSNKPVKTTTENTIRMIQEQGAWFISDVLGNQTTFEFPVGELSKISG